MVEFKNIARKNWYTCTYDHTEEFTLSDGGKINLDFRGPSFKGEVDEPRPLVIIVAGLTSDSGTGYIQNVVEHLNKGCPEGGEPFEVCVINYRGLGGQELATPRMYCASSTDDIAEPLQYIC